MAEFDLKKFRNQLVYAFDFCAMMGDVQDFLEFSELNIDGLLEREIHRIEQSAPLEDCEPDFKENYESSFKRQLIKDAEHRFTASLPMRIRYAALVALVSTVEWQTKFLVSSKMPALEIPKEPSNTNVLVRFLMGLDAATGGYHTQTLREYGWLVWVRNAVTHAAGLIRDYERGPELMEIIPQLPGFSIDHWHFFGESVKIERGALNPYIERMQVAVPDLEERGHNMGLLKYSD